MTKVSQRLRHLVVRFLTGALLVLVVATGITLFNSYLPVYLETDLLPSLANQAGISAFSCDVRSIGLNHADISDLRVGSTEENAVRIDSVRLDYSIQGLFKRHIKQIIISDPKIELHYPVSSRQSAVGSRQPAVGSKQVIGYCRLETADWRLPVTVGKIDIRHAVLAVAWQGQNFRLPLDIEIMLHKQKNDASSLRRADSIIHLYPAGQELICKAAIDFDREDLTLSLDADDLQLAKFKDYLPVPDDMLLRSDVEIHAKAKISSALAPLNLADIQADLYFRNFKAGYKYMVLENLPANTKEHERRKSRPPLHIHLTGKSAQNWEFAVTNIAVSSPVHINIEKFSGNLEPKADQIQATGNYSMITALNDTAASNFNFEPIKIKGHYQAKANPDGAWDFLISASALKTQINLNQLTATSPSQQIKITGQGLKGAGNIRFDGNVNDWQAFYLNGSDKKFNGKAISLKGQLNFDDLPDSMPPITFSLKTPVNGFINKNIRFKIPTFITTGQAGIDKQGQISFDGQVQLKDARVNDSGTHTAINGIHLKLPLQWPCLRTGAKGTLAIKKLQWQKKSLGSIKATLNQTLNHKKTGGVVFKGNYFSSVLPNLTAFLSGQLNLSSLTDYQAETKFQVSRYQTGANFDITRLVPQAKGFAFNGELNMNAGLTIRPSGVSGQLQSEINAARIELKEKGLIIQGIDVQINIPDLPKLRSAPGQVFSFKKAALGNLKFDHGKIKFQIESAQSFLIETGEFGWCDGHVDTPAIRIKADVKDYSGVLYCDRLNFSKLLNQLGNVKANGQGSVNGRLPVRFMNNKISFQDGFLYSTPGEGGAIQVISASFGQSDMLADGNAQVAQIELAREALKDYTYKWVKLNLTTQGELLKARLQMDGKPAKPLPFIYDKKLGAFTRIEAGAGSRFQGIRLDVNFSLPLNKILHYGTKLQ